MLELKIKKKYFDAILELNKPFELRHEPIPKGTIVKLVEITDWEKIDNETINLNYMARFVYGKLVNNDPEKWEHKDFEIIRKHEELSIGEKIKNLIDNGFFWFSGRYIIFESGECDKLISFNASFGTGWLNDKQSFICGFSRAWNKERQEYKWYDNFCWDYINEKQTYLIEIAKILEVK